ncbi:4493_t:CDS:2, partial [Racocetra persica]
IYRKKTFGTWKEYQETLECYANFAIRKKQVDNSRDLRQHTWDCERSGKYVSYKTASLEKQRNKGSKRIGCLFLMNAYKSKGFDNETIIKLTLMYPEHNHQLIPENASFATSYRKLITDMKELIESYTICNNDVSFQQTIEATGVQPRAFMIDTDPGLESVVSEIYPDTYLLHCVWYIGCNIEKQLAKLLGNRYTDFIKVFYHARNVLCKETFEEYWKQLMIDFLESTEYLLRQLDPHKTTWAKAFTEEQFAGRFVTWREKTVSYMIPSVPERLFPNIYNILQNFENPYNLILEVVDNRPIEFEYDFCQIWFDKLLEGVDYSLVAEVWDVQSIKHNSHWSSLPSLVLYEFMDTMVADELFVRNKSLEKNTKVIGHKQSIKGTLLELARKCVEVVNYDDLNDSKILMETFKE